MADKDYRSGDEIRAFSGSVSGNFSEILPATPGEGLVWDATELYTKGRLRVSAGSGIDRIQAEQEDTPIYDLSGHRRNNAGKGIYIQGKKKMVRK